METPKAETKKVEPKVEAKPAEKVAEVAEAAVEKEVELQFGSSYEKDIDAIIEKKPLKEYVPETGLDKLRKKLSQRKLRDQYYEEIRKKNE